MAFVCCVGFARQILAPFSARSRQNASRRETEKAFNKTSGKSCVTCVFRYFASATSQLQLRLFVLLFCDCFVCESRNEFAFVCASLARFALASSDFSPKKQTWIQLNWIAMKRSANCLQAPPEKQRSKTREPNSLCNCYAILTNK